MAGMFAFMLPCCSFCLRTQKRWADGLLDESDPSNRRVDALIVKKWAHKQAQQGSCMLVIEFQVQGIDGKVIPIRAPLAVSAGLWCRVYVGSEVEVVYRAGREKDFAIVPELHEIGRSFASNHKMMCCIFSMFACIGLALGIGSLLLTGCFVGPAIFSGLVLGGALSGHFVCFRIGRMLAKFAVSTSGSPSLQEQVVYGMANVDRVDNRVIWDNRNNRVIR